VAWAAASAFYIPNEHLQGISALGTGIILWLNAAFALGLAWLTTRESTNSANTREARLTR
jgi:F0F1-type ATP synthase assembly protein I